MGDVLISGPAEEPVSVAELRSYLRDPADADSVLTRLIKAAREYVEEATGLIMVSQTRELTLDAWPGGGDGLGWWDGVQEGALIGRAPRYVELPRGPLISITSVKTYDTGNNAATWEAGNYFADTGNRPGRLALLDGAVWPVPTRAASGIVIRYVAGHANAAAVPNALCMAILQIAAHWYENRELASLDAVNKVPMQAGRILSKFRVAKL